MAKLAVVLLATFPFWCFFLWAAWWFATDHLRERRRDRLAVGEVQQWLAAQRRTCIRTRLDPA